MSKLPKFTEYSPEEIANADHIMISYKSLIAAAREDKPLNKVKYVREDLQIQLGHLTREELIHFDDQVRDEMNVIERRQEIKRLRMQIKRKADRLGELLNTTKEQ